MQAGQISDALGASVQEVQHMNRRLHARDFSLNTPISQMEDGIEFQETLIDEGPGPEALVGEHEELQLRSGMLKRAMAELSERERDILVRRRLSDEPLTLEELGTHYGISRERIRQLESRAFDKVQKFVQAEATAA